MARAKLNFIIIVIQRPLTIAEEESRDVVIYTAPEEVPIRITLREGIILEWISEENIVELSHLPVSMIGGGDLIQLKEPPTSGIPSSLSVATGPFQLTSTTN
jgi:hypothetical protein